MNFSFQVGFSPASFQVGFSPPSSIDRLIDLLGCGMHPCDCVVTQSGSHENYEHSSRKYPPELCSRNERHQTKTFSEAVDQYAQMGLRTLCLAWRELNEIEYQDWSLMFKEANSTLVDREWRVAEVCQRLEHDLEILGVAAIEDRLQDGVPETIETLRKAGINFWMLTGDKQNTAIQIALSCNFVSPGRSLIKKYDETLINISFCTLDLKTSQLNSVDL
ncbi:hypothetical protein Ccrd_006382 [Cynara cardunculus var. scolymus]|uniref:HAD-like domain-containing protein n=1 Tax=Cynara cardunculus var. scolymus TaxID=59895 RepID=A0A103XIY5_CYNCS|nr:hypothetical protein Ccrd_006382 [Cynara cardunculus var. scolymus]